MTKRELKRATLRIEARAKEVRKGKVMVKTKPARRFVVGFKAPRQTTVWGKLHFLPAGHPDYDMHDLCDMMTATEARRALKELGTGGTICELVPVDLSKRTRP